MNPRGTCFLSNLDPNFYLHMTFSCREMEGQPFALCPRNPKSLPLVKELVEQVLRLHPDITHLHIGADEVWNIGDTALWARIEKK